MTLRSDEEVTNLLSVARQLRRSDDEVARSSVYLNPDLTPAEIQLAYEQRVKRRRLKARPEASRSTNSMSDELQTDHADKHDDYALYFPKLTISSGSDDDGTERLS